MGEYEGVVGGVGAIITQEFKPWWAGYEGTVDFDNIEGRELGAREAFEKVLDWQVQLEDVYTCGQYIDGDGNVSSAFEKVPHKKASVRSDTREVLGIVSDGYGITQNEVVVEFVEALKAASGGEVQVKSAGTLFGSRQVWMLAKLGDDAYFGDSAEQIQRYFLVATGHDGSLALSARATNVRVECMNTFDWALKGTRSLVSLRHTSNVSDRYDDAKKVIAAAYDHYAAIDAEIETMLATEYSKQMYQGYVVPTLCGPRPDEDAGVKLTHWIKRHDGLIAAYERPDQANIQGTAWGAVMAVNSFENWSTTVRGQSRAEAQARKAVKSDYPLTAQVRELVAA